MTRFNLKHKAAGTLFTLVLLAMTMFSNTVFAADVRAKGYEAVLVGIVEVKDINIDTRQLTLTASDGKTTHCHIK